MLRTGFGSYHKRNLTLTTKELVERLYLLVGAFLGKSARLLQWLVFFFFRQTTISL